MKTLLKFTEKTGLKVCKVYYKGWGKKWKGFDLIRNDKEILISFEPNVNGKKWYVRNSYQGYDGPRYLNRITKKYLETLNTEAPTSYVNYEAKNTFIA